MSESSALMTTTTTATSIATSTATRTTRVVPRPRHVVSAIVFAACTCWTVASILLVPQPQSSSSSLSLHPALGLLWLATVVHVSMLWQGIRVALPSLVQDERIAKVNTEEEAVFRASHPYAAAAYERAIRHKINSNNNYRQSLRLQAFASGAQACLMLLVLTSAPMVLLPSYDYYYYDDNAPSKMVSWTNLVSFAVWWTTLWQVASMTARTRRLDILNTPAVTILWYASWVMSLLVCWPKARTTTFPQTAYCRGDRVEESNHNKSTSTTTTSRTVTHEILVACRIFLAMAATCLATVVVAWHVEGKYGWMACLWVLTLMGLAAVCQAIPVARQQLSPREMQAAEITAPPETNDSDYGDQGGRQLLVVTCWLGVAFFLTATTTTATTTTTEENLLYFGARALAGTILLTTMSQAVQTLAVAFPVAFLTHFQAIDTLSRLLSALTAVAPILVPLAYPSHQQDAVYLGHDNVPPLTEQDDEHDVESPGKATMMIDSYPTPLLDSKDPLVFEEQAF